MDGVVLVLVLLVVVVRVLEKVKVNPAGKQQHKDAWKQKNTKQTFRDVAWRKNGDVMHVNHYQKETHHHHHYSADPCAYAEHFSWKKGAKNIYDDPWDF